MPNGQTNTRYHAEIKVTLQGRDARINVFADTLNEIFSDLAKITIQYDELHSLAKREILNAELKANSLPRKSSPSPKSRSPLVNAPVCLNCGSPDSMELIRWNDKKTGQPRQAWKCQACDEWHYENVNAS